MGVPVGITFHRLSPVDWIEEDVRTRAAKLARYCHLLRDCRVVIDLPHRHHLQGNRVRFHLELAVPDEPIAVTRDAPMAASPRELAFVIRETFDVARRQLQDYSRRHRLAVKRHSLPSTGGRATAFDARRRRTARRSRPDRRSL